MGWWAVPTDPQERAFSCLASSLPSLCPQNAERLLETAGIKVGCLEADVGSSIIALRDSVHRALWMRCSSYRPAAPLYPHRSSDVGPAGDCGHLG